jgi:hypothetical protein
LVIMGGVIMGGVEGSKIVLKVMEGGKRVNTSVAWCIDCLVRLLHGPHVRIHTSSQIWSK